MYNIKLDYPISFVPNGQFEPICVSELPIVVINDSLNETIKIQLEGFNNTFNLYGKHEYNEAINWSQIDIEKKIKSIIDASILKFLYSNQSSKKYNKNSYVFEYNLTNINDTIIIIAYFSPCNYQKPKQNLLLIVNKLIEYQHPVCVMECVMPYADELELPQQVIHHKIYANDHSYMFLKENLYNIALQKLNYNKYIFLDGDIIFNNPNWLDDTNKLLDKYDIVQPFEYCYWMNKDGHPYPSYAQSAAKCISNRVAPLGTKYHPGFCWGATKEFLNKTQGFFDQAILGGGDMAIWLALNSYPMDNPIRYIAADMLDKPYPFFNTDLFKEWHQKVIDAQPKVGYLKNCIAYHLYHGSRKNRQYQDRFKLLPPYKNNNYPITKNLNGIYEWDDPPCSKLIYEKYFLQRNEDN